VGLGVGGSVGRTVGGKEGITVGSDDGTSVGFGVGNQVGKPETVGIGDGTASNLPPTMQKVVFLTSSVLGRLMPPLTDGEVASKSAIVNDAVKARNPVMLNK